MQLLLGPAGDLQLDVADLLLQLAFLLEKGELLLIGLLDLRLHLGQGRLAVLQLDAEFLPGLLAGLPDQLGTPVLQLLSQILFELQLLLIELGFELLDLPLAFAGRQFLLLGGLELLPQLAELLVPVLELDVHLLANPAFQRLPLLAELGPDLLLDGLRLLLQAPAAAGRDRPAAA